MKKTETINICGSGTFPKGNPCYVPNTNIGSFTTNPVTYNNPSIGTIIGGLNNTVPTSYVPVTNPYITQSSTFPTFTPPVFQTPITKPIQSESKNIPSELVPYFASHSGKVIGWLEHQNKTLNLNFNIAGKDLDMSNKQITDENMLFFCQKIASFTFHFDNLIISNNLMTNLSVQYLFNATLTSPTNRTIKNLDLRNNQIGDVGAELIAAYLKHGYMPATTHVNLADNIITDKGAQCFAESFNSSVNKLKVLHLEGNNLTPFGSNPKIINLVQNVKQDIKILVSKVTNIKDGMKKQGTLFFGSKEEKQKIIKDILKQSQENGVDVKNVTVSKDIFEALGNFGSLSKNFSYGWTKCTLVPNSVKSYVGDKIIAKASPLAGQINTAMDVATCYFESFDENASSKEGVQFMGDIGFITQAEFFNVNE